MKVINVSKRRILRSTSFTRRAGPGVQSEIISSDFGGSRCPSLPCFLQRRLKRLRDERLREQCLRTVEMEPLSCQPAGYLPPPPPPPPPQLPREPPQFCPPHTMTPPLPLLVPHPLPRATWISMPDTELLGKPPCYEEAVLMEDPPPPYSEVLADPRWGTFLKPAPPRAAAPPPPPPPPLREDPPPVFRSETSKLPVATVFPDRGYSSLIRLPSSQRWDSLGRLLSNMDLNHDHLDPPGGRSLQAATAMATMPRRETRTQRDGLALSRGGVRGLQGEFQGLQGVHRLRGLESGCGLPTAFPLLGRSTAV
ncbi:proline-rich protein 7 isoform X1 [Scophthalmus maximus]|uniref:proline-rich protein 7 isoform X1 n=1 Tax=Scophthalmus maximus TaxID=52904 RepID=UPI001FA87414|nr:proline-rich protein 7 isoform X1 [Scophthalmus maximus]XP_035481438.2 proline-rich protein 7 isoform X1 [Scophthalmus maximus]